MATCSEERTSRFLFEVKFLVALKISLNGAMQFRVGRICNDVINRYLFVRENLMVKQIS